MPTIKYKFADGTTSEIEVTDELYALHLQLVQEEKRNHWRETRRHTSLEYLNENGIDFESPAADPLSVLLRSENEENGIDFESPAADPLSVLLRSENEERIHKAMAALSDKQKRLVQAVFYEGKSLREIARQSDISHQALSKQLATVYKKIKKFF